TIENQSDVPISEILVPASPGLQLDKLTFAGDGALISFDSVLNVNHYRLQEPLLPGQRTRMQFKTSTTPPAGFAVHAASDNVPEVSPVEVIGNGTSLLNLRIMPAIGYTDRVEHKPAWKRRKYGLPEQWQPPHGVAAERQGHGTLHLGWVESLEMTIRTDADQIAVHAGVLEEEWTEPNGRRGFRYKINHKSRGWSSIVSARYEKRVFEHAGLPAVEVYYDPQHAANVEPFAIALHEAMEYFARHYGPPPFETFRLAEQSLHYAGFSSRSGFATCSEILGWKSDLNASGGEDIRQMAALMMALSWWGDQVIPANVAGAKVIHAGIPYWSAALYLRSIRDSETDVRLRRQAAMELFRHRGEMVDQEAPFFEEFKDSTMIRKKGAFLMLHLEDQLRCETNAVELVSLLSDFLAECRYREPPYPTATELLKHLESHVPPSLHSQLADIFTRVTSYSVRIREATCHALEEGRWQLTAEVDVHQFVTEGWGVQTEVPFDTPITIMAFAGREPSDDHVLWESNKVWASGTNRIEATLDSQPRLLGVDPFLTLPDAHPHDNLRVPVVEPLGTHR
ncbi:MAG: hypothetical protein AAGF97_16640, partial [Planctomycetota bacterium]